MKTLFKIAWRNLFRQKARLALNLTLLVGSFCVIVMFEGFAAHVLGTIRDLLATTQIGDLQIAKTKLFEETPVDSPSEKLIKDHQPFIDKIVQMPEVLNVGSRLEFFGLANTEDKSIPVRIVGFQPKLETQLQQNVLFKEGRFLQNRKEVIVGEGLRKTLAVKVGEDITVVGQSLGGGMNAMDLQVVGVIATGFSEIDNSSIYVNLEDAQKVMDTETTERILVHLKHYTDFYAMQKRLQAMPELPKESEVRTWRDLSNLYLQVEQFYIVQNLVVEIILIVLIFLSVSNATNITVFERLGEIGTLRALGDFEFDIQKIFFVESAFLGLLSVVIGVPIVFLLIQLITAMHIKLLLPMASESLPVIVVPTVVGFVKATACCLGSVMLASILPARRGATTPITIALKAKV